MKQYLLATACIDASKDSAVESAATPCAGAILIGPTSVNKKVVITTIN